jgi:NAD(P)-dependent dehydrogenase (short-subunit alcohol dehydrogenase family)
MSVVLITGSSTGIGNLTARALARAGHTVYASMRDPRGRNAGRAEALLALGSREHLDLRIVELDVQSQGSADAAVATVTGAAGQLDVVVQNAGHLYAGYTEAFTAREVARLLDVNVLGAQRVNRAALPHMREQGRGALVWVGSTTTVTVPPFLGPYVVSKAAMDSLAVATAYEVSQFGIETTIIMPGAFTSGTEHFPNASQASDSAVTSAYARLDPLVSRNEEATSSLFRPDEDADPAAVADEITRILALPHGAKPFRSVVDYTHSGVEIVTEAADAARESFVKRMGFGQLLRPAS